MGLYLRRSVRLGPFRLNLSRRGLGVSAGVTGARVGIDAAGRSYVQSGRRGLYYRAHGQAIRWGPFVLLAVLGAVLLVLFG